MATSTLSTPPSGPGRAWILAARPRTLAAAAAPVLVGSAVAAAYEGFRAAPAAAALAGAFLIQIGTNFANDLGDFQKGADAGARVGPTRAVQAGLISPASMRAATVACFVAATACGVYLAWVAGWPVVAIGLTSIAAGLAYTGGPFPLAYNGLGDAFVMAFFGFVAVCGTTFVQLGHVPGLAWWAALPVGCLATNILVVNNLRDRDTDARAGKRTLAVFLGRRATIAEYAVLLALAYVVPVTSVATRRTSPWLLLTLLTAPAAMRALRSVARDTGPRLNATLGASAQILLWYAVLFALGLVLPLWLAR